MKIFADENIPNVTVTALRDMGHDVADIRGTRNQGISDEEIWKFVKQEKRLLITTDKGFSTYRDEEHYGILIVRLKKPNQLKIHQRVIQAITRYSEYQWQGLMVVMRDIVQSVIQSRER
jgi:predicted nuclease of predicted toxin-antitoxin system